MNAGSLDRRIAVESRIVSRDEVGGRSESWEVTYSCWAGLVKGSGKTSDTAGAERPVRTRSFRIRWRDDIQPGTHRIIYQSNTFAIEAVNEEGRNESLVIDCRQLEGLEL
jgi:SPP1 family predicted phage head-tail adaptor